MRNFEFKKSLGQNFIKDDNIIDKIVKYSNIAKDTLVIEVGPGAGSLSKKIIPLCGYALLYEIDTRLAPLLDETLGANNNYKVIYGDFLKQDIKNIKQEYKYKKVYVVANLPYYITTPIIQKLVNEIYPDKILIMVQEEVADRLSASSGGKEYGMISVMLGSKYDIKKLFKVSRKCFVPMPNVDSAVVELVKNDKLGNKNLSEFEKFIKNAFQFKRKNLKNNLKAYDLVKLEKVLNKYGYNLSSRAEEISVTEFINIFDEMK
jgi:16S rRNA (adenine1518-N6/adenine1519-N6)-dimethyltransferase